MKPTVLAVVVLAAVGWLGLGQPPEELWEPWMGIPEGAGGGPIEVGASFEIPGSFLMWSEGDLDFSGDWLAKVTDPSYISGPNLLSEPRTNHLFVYWATNVPIQITREVWAYKGQGTCAKLLPTYTFFGIYRWDWEKGWGGYVWWVHGWVEAKPPETGYRSDSYEVSACSAGYYCSRNVLWAFRDGYNDPTDTYVARVKFTISGL